jgi:hypothetical protein
MFHKEVEAGYSEKHEQRIRASILGETDVIGHQGQREGTEKCNVRRKLSCKEIDHGDGEGSENQRDDPEVSFWLCEWVELVGKDEKEGRV